jgi:hypothetical protein
MRVFRHVFGAGFALTGMPSPEHVGLKERLHEMVGLIMLREVLRGTAPGDDEAIKKRLLELVPGYGTGTKRRLAMRSLTGLVKARRVSP